MTAGIQGTGPYSKLKELRFNAKKIKYEIEMKDPGPRQLKNLRMRLVENALEIKDLLQSIKQDAPTPKEPQL